MLKRAYGNLKAKPIIDKKYIEMIREHIRSNYPHYSEREAAAAFAEALRSEVESYIKDFDDSYRNTISNHIFKVGVSRESFWVNAADIFEACLKVDTDEGVDESRLIDELTDWVNQIQGQMVERQSVVYAKKAMDNSQYSHLEDVEYLVAVADERVVLDKKTQQRLHNRDYSVKIHEQVWKTLYKAIIWISEMACKGLVWVNSRIKAEQGVLLKGYTFTKYDRISLIRLVSALILIVFLTVNGGGKVGIKSHTLHYATKTHSSMSRYFTLKSKMIQITGKHRLTDELPKEYRYREVDAAKIKRWLASKNSYLSQDKYIQAIIMAARRYNLNPLLLFAIAGQEQSFVPQHKKFAQKMANNPFNVFGSWVDYNTDINDSAMIAAETIVNSSKKRPVYINALKWINRRYAEDKKWWVGVSDIFRKLQREIQ